MNKISIIRWDSQNAEKCYSRILKGIKEGSWIIHDTTLNKINTHLDWYTLLIEINKEYEVWATAPADFHLN